MSVKLKLDWCSYEATKYAVDKWHYSQAMPSGKLVKIGVWENDEFVGCVVFGRGATNNIGKPYSLTQTEVCELVRVAMRQPQTPVSRLIAISLKMLRHASPGIRLVVSYADEQEQNHVGTVYQASNWVYVGKTQPKPKVIINGKARHMRSASSLFGTIIGLEKTQSFWKHKYLYPFDGDMRNQIEPLRQPYPKKQ